MRQKEPLPSKLKFPGNTTETPFCLTGAFRMQNKQFPVENPAGNRLGYPDAFGPKFSRGEDGAVEYRSAGREEGKV